MNTAIQDFIQGKRIAVVGASRSGKKFGNIAAKELISRGYDIYVVHPEAKELEGKPCYPNLAALSGKVDGVFLSVSPEQGKNVLKEAADAGLRNVWVQQQGETPELIAQGKQLGLNLIYGKCLLMYATPVRGFHGLHRGITWLTGKL